MSKLDKAFNEKLYDRLETVPEGLWDKIESKLDAAEAADKTRLPIWGIATTVVVLSILLAGIYSYTSRKDDISRSNNQDLLSEVSNGDKKENITNINRADFNNSTDSNSNTKSTIANSTTNASQTASNSTNTLSNIKNITDLQLDINNTNNRTISLSAEIQRSAILNEKQFDIKTSDNIDKYQKSSSDNFGEADENSRNNVNNNSRTNEVINAQASLSKDKVTTEAVSIIGDQSRVLAELAILGKQETFSLQNELREYDANRLLTDCPSFIETRPGFHLELYVSPDFAVRSFSSADSELDNYIARRDVSESAFLSFSAGFRISYTTKSGIAFKTGVNYSQINEIFDYRNPDSLQITRVLNEAGEILEESETYGLGEIRTHNAYRSLDIPLLVALEMPFNDKFSVGLNTGVFVNLLFSQKGSFLNQELNPVSISGSNYKSSLGLSFTGSIALHFYLSPRVDFMIEPNLRYYSQSFTSNSYPISQEYLKLGLLTGIRYNF